MKEKFLFLKVFLICGALSALELPDGTEAKVTDLKLTNGRITQVVLKEDIEIETPVGAKKVTGQIDFYESGAIKSIIPVDGGKIETPAGTLSYSGVEILNFEIPVENSDFEATDADDTESSENPETAGEVVEIAGSENSATVENYTVPVMPSPLFFYESGCVKEITLNEETKIKAKIGELTVQADTVKFYDNYNVETYKLKNNCSMKLSMGKLKISNKGNLSFYESGRIKSFTLAENCPLVTNSGMVCAKADTEISLHENGKLKTFTADDIYKISYDGKDFYCEADSAVSFYKNGKLEQITVVNNEILLGNFNLEVNKNGAKINFYADGTASVDNIEAVTVKNYSQNAFDACEIFYKKLNDHQEIIFASNSKTAWKGIFFSYDKNTQKCEKYALDFAQNPELAEDYDDIQEMLEELQDSETFPDYLKVQDGEIQFLTDDAAKELFDLVSTKIL